MNAHTKQQQDKVFEMDFIDSQKSDPPFAHLLALSHILVTKGVSAKGDLVVLRIKDVNFFSFRHECGLNVSK